MLVPAVQVGNGEDRIVSGALEQQPAACATTAFRMAAPVTV
jgi:hypothetical protein